MKALLTQNAGYLKWLPLIGFVGFMCGWGIVLLAESLDFGALVVTGATLGALALGAGLAAFGVTTLFAPEVGQRFAREGWWLLWGPKDWGGREAKKKVLGLGASLLAVAILVLPVLARL